MKSLLIHKRIARRESQKRKPFTNAQLSLILQHPEFVAQRDGQHPERYWLILALLLSGARREEIAQLRTEDIREEEGCLFFNIIPEEPDQSTKTPGGRRRVPIHKDLERLGFRHYVKRMRRAKEKRLFPKAEKGE